MDDENNRIWFNYYHRERDLIKESPMRTGEFDSYDYEGDTPKIVYNRVVASDSKYKLIDIQKHDNGSVVKLYELHEGDNDYHIKLLVDRLEIIVGHISYSLLSDNGIEINSIYNQPLFKGIIFKIYFDYFLKKYDYILSGGVHSPKGEIFWEKIVAVGKKNGYNIKVVDIDKTIEYPIDDIRDIKKYYDGENYRIKIESE